MRMFCQKVNQYTVENQLVVYMCNVLLLHVFDDSLIQDYAAIHVYR